MKLRFARLRPDAVLPSYETAGAAGMDLVACMDQPVRLGVGERALIPTGLAMALPAGYEGQVRPRSGLAWKNGVTVANAPGTIDEDYRGEVKVILINLGTSHFEVQPGMRIAQLVVAPVTRVEVELAADVEALGDTSRGSGGFGSTGTGAGTVSDLAGGDESPSEPTEGC